MDLDLNYLTAERVTLVSLLQEAGIEVYADVGDCDRPDIAGYTSSDPSNGTIMVVVCTENLREVHQNEPIIRQQINFTIDHEGLHAAQFCLGEGYPGPIEPVWDNETEATWYEGKTQAVGQQVIRFCF